MSRPDGGAGPGPGVTAGARVRGLPALIGAVAAAFVLVEALLLALGLLVTRVLDDSELEEQEVAFTEEVLTHRTPLWDDLTRYGSLLGATATVVALTAAGCLVLALRRHGPRLPVFLAVAVLGETLLFLLASTLLDRVRPPIPQLDVAPPTSSFPSGHTAASIALWGGLALGLARTRPGHRLRSLVTALAVVLPLVVLLSRLYRGMHWPTDVAASVVFTVVWLFLLRAVLLPAARQEVDSSAPSGGSPRAREG